MTRDTPSGDFGSHLRQARERRGVSLRAIADVTRISVAALDGLERNDISRLPGGIFSRGFVRAYANEVGLDPDSTVDEFVRCFPDDSVTDGHPAAVRARIIDDVNEIKRRRMPRAGWFVVVAAPVVIAIVYLSLARVPPAAAPAPGGREAIAPCTGPYVVELRASAQSSVSYAVDGQPRQQVSLAAGASRRFEVSHDVDLRVSDAGAIDLLINGVVRPSIGVAGGPGAVRLNETCTEVATS